MSFLVIGGVTMRARDFKRSPNEHRSKPRRVLSGQLRGASGWTKRAWTAEVVATSDAAADQVWGTCDGYSDRVCSGDALPAPITAKVEVTGDSYQRTGPGARVRVLSLTLREV